jgi:hypothetical protein
MSVPRLLALFLAALLGLTSIRAADPPRPRPRASLLSGLAPLGRLEFVEMLTAIVTGKPPIAGFGWFHPAQSCYDWKWLAARYDSNHDGVITREEFQGPTDLFERLDRNHDGRITPDDFDWSEKSPLTRQANIAEQLFRRADKNSNGLITASEWQALFQQAAKGKDTLTPEDLRNLLFPPPAKDRPPMKMPSPLTLLAGLFSGEIGSASEGPRIGQRAPAFRLKTHDGAREYDLDQLRGKKPVVLIFGSFT